MGDSCASVFLLLLWTSSFPSSTGGGCFLSLYHEKDADSKLAPPSGCCRLIGAVTVSSNRHSVLLSGQLLQDGGEHGKTSGFRECGPTVTLGLVRSNAVWNTVMVEKHVSPWMVVLAEALRSGKANP